MSCVLFFLFCWVQVQAIVGLDELQYEQMPPILSLDPYQSCLRVAGAQYCTGYVAYVADNQTPLLTMMQEFSAHIPTHYNHTRALYGTCILRKCKEFYNPDETPPDLGRILEACLNHSVSEHYNLKVKVEESFTCVAENDKPHPIYITDIIVAAILLSLVILNVVGSFVDVCFPKQRDWPGSGLLLSFSIQRNFKSLTAPCCKVGISFKALYGLRAILISLVVVVHCMLPVILASANPRFVEGMYDMVPLHMLYNGTVVMQTFLFMSAMLLVYNLQVYSEKNSVKWLMLPWMLFKRWLRLTPPYALVIAVTATWLRFIGSGPMWNEVIVSEATECRRDWWMHLLYVNNYVDNSKCMPQAWYLATDTQLHCLGIISYVLCKNLVSRKVILSSLFIIGMILPTLHTYFQDLDGTLIVSPTSAIELFSNDRNFHNLYKRGHTNVCCYIMGMATGYLVYHLQKNNFDLSKYRKWRPIYWCVVPTMAGMFISCKVFYEEGPRAHIAYRMLLAAFMKPVFGLLVGALIVGAIFKMDDSCRGFLEWKGWRVPARLSYSAYLLHVTLIRIICGTLENPVVGSYLHIFESCLFMVTLTFLAAAIFWVTVENPMAQVIRSCFIATNAKEQPKNKEKTEDKNTKL